MSYQANAESNHSYKLGPEKRIKKRRDFLLIQSRGVRYFGKFVVVLSYQTKNLKNGCFGLTVPKKIGPAHQRNKIKRQLRHVLRLNQEFFLNRQLVIVARSSVINSSFLELNKDLLNVCKNIPNKTAFRKS